MLPKIIAIGIQKGGAGKTTTAAMTALLLARRGSRVLAVDMDAQGSLTSLLSHRTDISAFRDNSILNALLSLDDSIEEIQNIIIKSENNLDLLPSEDLLAILPRLVYTDPEVRAALIRHHLEPPYLLRNLLSRLFAARQYDYVIIDTPPHLGDQTVNAFAAAQHIVVPFEASAFCLDALPVLAETVDVIRRDANPDLHIAGILCTIYDTRRSDAQTVLSELRTTPQFGPLLFDTVIRRRAAIGRMPLYGTETPEIMAITNEYNPYIEELIARL